MARYRALNALFVRRLIVAGEEFESDLPPGRNWAPLDEAARAAVAARGGNVVQLRTVHDRIDRTPPAPAAVDIPEDWRDLKWAQRRAIALKLGAPNTINRENADAFIAEMAQRRLKAAG